MDEWEQRHFDRLEANGYLPALRTYAQSFCAPLWWWVQARGRAPRVVHGGTACLVNTGTRRLTITCNHVYEAILRDRKKYPTLTCQIANAPFDETTLIDSDETTDIATFSMGDDLPTERIYNAATWPPTPLGPGESVMLAGFPGALRKVQDSNNVRSDFVVFLAKAENPSERKMSLRVNDTYWPEGSDRLPTQADLGGMSGGPVFRRHSDAVEDIEIAAFVYESQPGLEIVYSVQAWCVRADGRINRATHL